MHICETNSSVLCEQLRAAVADAPGTRLSVTNNERLVPDLYLSWDDSQGAVQCHRILSEGTLLDLNVMISGEPGWVSLNIELGTASFTPGATLIAILNAQAEGLGTIRPFIRTQGPEGWESTPDWRDTAFDWEADMGYDGVKILPCSVRDDAPLAIPEGFHTLVVPLPTESFRLTLKDLRMVVIA
ncbi:hypothetical protein C4N9_03400 [Pararhodobacter marinus]|uniref:Uncharacterized protein n=1 Tax=Pararhodobacter marinus TaxID=2184063 RepID=A0A2U2CG02_9RHOB|nr:hypothetical protein [Pararhodobacter marinus]PWE30816.1 hypothetical protein C4N9_03400 [Pararhodobacter marinus]